IGRFHVTHIIGALGISRLRLQILREWGKELVRTVGEIDELCISLLPLLVNLGHPWSRSEGAKQCVHCQFPWIRHVAVLDGVVNIGNDDHSMLTQQLRSAPKGTVIFARYGVLDPGVALNFARRVCSRYGVPRLSKAKETLSVRTMALHACPCDIDIDMLIALAVENEILDTVVENPKAVGILCKPPEQFVQVLRIRYTGQCYRVRAAITKRLPSFVDGPTDPDGATPAIDGTDADGRVKHHEFIDVDCLVHTAVSSPKEIFEH